MQLNLTRWSTNSYWGHNNLECVILALKYQGKQIVGRKIVRGRMKQCPKSFKKLTTIRDDKSPTGYDSDKYCNQKVAQPRKWPRGFLQIDIMSCCSNSSGVSWIGVVIFGFFPQLPISLCDHLSHHFVTHLISISLMRGISKILSKTSLSDPCLLQLCKTKFS